MLEHFYPVEENEEHTKQPYFIWIIIIAVSGTSFLILLIFRPFFECQGEDDEEKSKSD